MILHSFVGQIHEKFLNLDAQCTCVKMRYNSSNTRHCGIFFVSIWLIIGSVCSHVPPPYNKSQGESNEDTTVNDFANGSSTNNRVSSFVTPSLPDEGSADQYGDDSYDRRESQYVDGGLPASCCAEVSRYLAVLAEDGRRQGQQTRQYYVHLANLVQTASEALAQVERSAGQVAELRAMLNELREEINFTRTGRLAASAPPVQKSSECDCPCTAEARQRPTVTVHMDEKHKVMHLCSPMPIPNPSFETRDRSWIPYSKGYDFWTGDALDGHTAIKVFDGGARQVLRFPPGTRSFIISATSKSSGVPGSASINYSLYCDVKQSDRKWEYGRSVRFIPNSDWHERRLKVTAPPQMSIMEAWCYVMFRRYPGGTAFFDNVRVWLTSPDTAAEVCK